MTDLKQLEYFAACVQNGSFSKAAQQLYTSQPHVSEVIKKLENNLSTILFYRSPSGISLTASGRHVYEYAQNILKEYRLMELSVQKMNGQEFTVMSNSSKRMGAFFAQFYQKHRADNIRFSYIENGAEEIIQGIAGNKAELGFFFYPESKQNTIRFLCEQNYLRCEVLNTSGMVLYVGKQNPLYYRNSVKIEELKDFYYVQMKEDYFSLDDLLIRMFPYPEDSSKIIITNSNNGIQQILLHTAACNLGTYWKKDFYLDKDIRLLPVEDYKKEIYFAAVYQKEKSLPMIAGEYLKEVKRALAEENTKGYNETRYPSIKYQ